MKYFIILICVISLYSCLHVPEAKNQKELWFKVVLENYFKALPAKKKMVEIPNLIDDSELNATLKLYGLGLYVEIIYIPSEFDGPVEKVMYQGKVLSEGALIEENETITLYVGKNNF